MSDSKKKKVDDGPRSFGAALAAGVPIVLVGEHTSDGKPEVLCPVGQECAALELLESKGIIRLIRPIKN